GGWVRGPSGIPERPSPCCGTSVRKYRYAPSPLFLGLVDLMLEGGREGVAKELTPLMQQQGFTGIEDAAGGSFLRFLLQLGRQLEGHAGNLALQRRLGQQWCFRHFPSSATGQPSGPSTRPPKKMPGSVDAP